MQTPLWVSGSSCQNPGSKREMRKLYLGKELQSNIIALWRHSYFFVYTTSQLDSNLISPIIQHPYKASHAAAPRVGVGRSFQLRSRLGVVVVGRALGGEKIREMDTRRYALVSPRKDRRGLEPFPVHLLDALVDPDALERHSHKVTIEADDEFGSGIFFIFIFIHHHFGYRSQRAYAFLLANAIQPPSALQFASRCGGRRLIQSCYKTATRLRRIREIATHGHTGAAKFTASPITLIDCRQVCLDICAGE